MKISCLIDFSFHFSVLPNICQFQLLKLKKSLPFLSFMIGNEESLGFGHEEDSEDITMGSGKL